MNRISSFQRILCSVHVGVRKFYLSFEFTFLVENSKMAVCYLIYQAVKFPKIQVTESHYGESLHYYMVCENLCVKEIIITSKCICA